ncbi:Rieske 2Fe-2S domain-containing protein [Candidatus Dojkabacteria bacterium]|nr:Rieske 2Fe-2S domain-containing protein [Candidatus Dojkabacteria bacterium]
MLKKLKQIVLYPFNFIKGKLSKSTSSIDSIKPGQGAVIEIDGRKTAVYKNADGSVLKLSPTCTHMGCTIEWNSDEGKWTCPCHGASFSKEGKVLGGPAKKDLHKIQREDSLQESN